MTDMTDFGDIIRNGSPELLRDFIDRHLADKIIEAMAPDNDLMDEYTLYGSIAFEVKHGLPEAQRVAELLGGAHPNIPITPEVHDAVMNGGDVFKALGVGRIPLRESQPRWPSNHFDRFYIVDEIATLED